MLLTMSLAFVSTVTGAANLDMITMHEIGESYPPKAEVIHRLGAPQSQTTYIVHKGHKYVRGQPLSTCSAPKADVEVTALYYSAEGDSAGYWMFFHKEQMLCFSGYVSHNAIVERDSL